MYFESQAIFRINFVILTLFFIYNFHLHSIQEFSTYMLWLVCVRWTDWLLWFGTLVLSADWFGKGSQCEISFLVRTRFTGWSVVQKIGTIKQLGREKHLRIQSKADIKNVMAYGFRKISSSSLELLQSYIFFIHK